MQSFPQLLRTCRGQRGRTQQQLAEQADVSTRHLSFIENGRAQPSRDMVMLLVDALEVPLRERNDWFVAAGFAPVYTESALDASTLGEARAALALLLRAYEPLPAVCFDRTAEVRMVNQACLAVAGALNIPVPGICAYELIAPPRPNMLSLLLLHPELRACIANWSEVAMVAVDRARRELMRMRDKSLRAMLEVAVTHSGLTRSAADGAPPRLIVPVELQLGEQSLRFFSTLTTFGTAFDITLEELRIESLHPADAQTEQAVRSGAWLG
jgi:transcriptional regulator with XRE-family HTH domain